MCAKGYVRAWPKLALLYLGQQNRLDGRGRFRKGGSKHAQGYRVRDGVGPKQTDRRRGLWLRAKAYPGQSPWIGESKASAVRHLDVRNSRPAWDAAGLGMGD